MSSLREFFIGPGAVLSGGVKVGSNVLIGKGAVILPGIEIQANAIIGGGAVVTKGIAENETVTGNPAKQLGKPAWKTGKRQYCHQRQP